MVFLSWYVCWCAYCLVLIDIAWYFPYKFRFRLCTLTLWQCSFGERTYKSDKYVSCYLNGNLSMIHICLSCIPSPFFFSLRTTCTSTEGWLRMWGIWNPVLSYLVLSTACSMWGCMHTGMVCLLDHSASTRPAEEWGHLRQLKTGKYLLESSSVWASVRSRSLAYFSF